MSNTAIYLRTSTWMQSTGLEAQLLALKTFCVQQGILQYGVYFDEGVSGAKSSRPSLDLLIQDVKHKKISKIITYSLSRLSRSTSHLLTTLEFFRSSHVEFISVTEKVELNTPTGKLILTVLGAIAELEREMTVERVKAGLANALSKGKKLGRPKRRDSKLIRELYRQKMPIRKIAEFAKCSTWCVNEEIKAVHLEIGISTQNPEITKHVITNTASVVSNHDSES